MNLRVPVWLSFGAESECGGGHCLQYFDHKILLFYAEYGLWLFFNPKQVLFTIFGHSNVRKGVGNDVSKVTFVIVFLDQNQNVVEDIVYDTLIIKSFYFMLNMVLGYFQPQVSPEKQHFPSRCSSFPTQMIFIQA